MRSETQVLERVKEVTDDDVFGWRKEVLIIFGLSFEAAKPWLKDDATGEGWLNRDESEARDAVVDYLEFAIGKAYDHRGISASRSIDKLTEWLWLLGEDDLLFAFEEADYQAYGAPKLQVLVDAWGAKNPDLESRKWQRMLEGGCCEECYS